MTKKLLTLENIRSGAVPSDAVAVGFLLGEIERLAKERASAIDRLAPMGLEIERLRTGLRQLAHKAGEEFGGFHSVVTFAEELLDGGSLEPGVGAPFPYPTDRDGWICSGCHGWNGPKTRVCLHSHVPLDPQGASREGSGGARSELHSPAVVSSRLPDGDGTLPPRLPPAANISEPFEQRVATSGTTVTGEDSVRKTAESSRPRGLLAQQMEPDISPLTHQEIFHAVNSWAAEIVRLTAAVPVQCTQGASRDTSPLSIAGTGCGNPVMTSAQSYAPCKQPEGHIGECDPPPQRT
jgi:hypothetical protein